MESPGRDHRMGRRNRHQSGEVLMSTVLAAPLTLKTTRRIGVGLFGCGTVGTSVAEIIAARNSWLQATHGISLDLRHIVVRDLGRERAPYIDRALLRAQVLPALRDA